MNNKWWFVIGNGAVARRGEILWTTEKLIRIKIYTETGKCKLVTYLVEKVNLVEVW